MIVCLYCNCQFFCYMDWIQHLVSAQHQRVIREALISWPMEFNNRSLVVIKNGNFQPKRSDICRFFENYGLIDICFGIWTDVWILHLGEKEYALKALARKHIMKEANTKLSLRLKSDFSSAELQSLMFLIPKTFDARHFQILTALRCISDLDEQFDFFIRQISMHPVKLAKIQQLTNYLKEIVQIDFPWSELCLYQECDGLETIHSNIHHLHFEIYGKTFSYKSLSANLKLATKNVILEKFKMSISKIVDCGFSFEEGPIKHHGELPSLNFGFINSTTHFRITFEDLLPSQMWKVIRLLLKLDPRLPSLFRFIGYWSQLYTLTLLSSLPDTIYYLLVVFLTKEGIIPPISVLQSMSASKMMINDWDASICEDVEKIAKVMPFSESPTFSINPRTGKPSAHSILELAAKFFKMYAHLDFRNLVVCPLVGDFLPKSQFHPGNENELPEALITYKNWVMAQEPHKIFNTNSALCIQHPFDLSCNVSIVTAKESVKYFQSFCSDTLERISVHAATKGFGYVIDKYNAQVRLPTTPMHLYKEAFVTGYQFGQPACPPFPTPPQAESRFPVRAGDRKRYRCQKCGRYYCTMGPRDLHESACKG